jgi:protein MpaA
MRKPVWALATLVVVGTAWLGAAHGSTTTGPASSTRQQQATGHRPAVIAKRVIGHSVKGRPIVAWELGQRAATTTAIIFAAHHGDEHAGTVALDALRDGRAVQGVNLWVVPKLNPDGYVRDTRQNARGVDLNRNFPRHWKRLTGYYYSGRRPASEPETRAAMRFMNNVDPTYVVSIHTPLHGIDIRHSKDRAFARTLARYLHLPSVRLNCGGRCHGTLSSWFNYHHKGACVTVEFGSMPSEHYLTVRAPRGLLRAVGGRYAPPPPAT